MNKCYLGASDPYLKAATVKWGQQEWKQELLNWVEAGGSSGGVVVCAGAGSEREREPERK